MHVSHKRRTLSVLLVLALLIVAVAVIVPIMTSADPAEIDDFGYQTLSAFDLTADADTDLRFVFTVGKLDYTEVGFVISKTNSTPTVGGANCYKAGTDTVYSTITADGTPIPAGDGRYWVAVKLTDIPRSYFDGSFYLCAFVTDGEGTRYSDVASFTVCTAAGHLAHTVSNLDQNMIGGTAAMNVVGTKIGYCDVCKLDNVTEYDATTEIEFQKWTGGGASSGWIDWRQMSKVLEGGKHFYPDESNNYEGNDLYVEFSLLWNETLYNFDWFDAGGARMETRFSTDKYGKDNAKSIGYMGLTDGTTSSGAKIAGAFEYPCGMISTSEPGNPYSGMIEDEQGYSAYPNIAGTDPDHPEWGWHRIGIKYHEIVTNLDEVRDNGDEAEYKLIVTLYIDGEVASILSGTDLKSDDGSYDYKLYTVSGDGTGALTYEDIDEDIWFSSFRIYGYTASTHDAYFVDGDFFVTCGQDFVHPVTRIDNPAARTQVVDGKTFTAPFYYTTVGAHEHVWGSLVDDASPFADCEHAATRSVHCTVCGVTKDDSTVNQAVDPARHSYTAYKTYQPASPLLGDGVERRICTCCGAYQDRTGADQSTAAEVYGESFSDSQTAQYADRKLLSDIQKGTHFYPTPENPEGKDLLIEYSVLWNHTLLNLDPGSSNPTSPFIETALSAWNGSDKNTLAWWSPTDNIDDSWCKYAGGFEAGMLQLRHDDGLSYTPAGMCAGGGNYAAYPNIGGNVAADAENLNNGHEWGWHHVQIRYHQEVTNVAEVKGGATAHYEFVLTTYFDGVPISMLRGTDTTSKKPNASNYLFTAENDGNGGITYHDNSKLSGKDSVKRTVWAYRLNTRKALAGKTVYWKEADIHYTCGNEFAMKVEKVASPAYVDLEIASGVHVNAAIYYRFAD